MPWGIQAAAQSNDETSSRMAKVKIMFVCLGNICRSPLAEAVFREHVRRAGLEGVFDIQSSGTGHWHVGNQADHRMRQTAARHGVPLDSHRAQQFADMHLEDFDHIIVMDKSNLHDVLYLDTKDRFGNKVRLFREFDPEPGDYQVPDPYYGGPEGFEDVFSIVDRTAAVLLERLIDEHQLNDHAKAS